MECMVPERSPDRRRERRWRAALVFAAVVVFAVLAAPGCTYRRSEIAPVIPDMSQSSRLYAADGTLLTVLHAEQDRELVTYAQLPPALVDAVVAIEDKRFWEHNGVDVQAVLRATKANATAGGIAEGGSTITQQYVKNAMLDPAQTVNRKVREMALALQLERSLSKELILELYLNTIYFGHGAYGVQAAAKTYFGLPVAQVDLAQSALLAGLIQSPSATDPYVAPEAALARRNVVLEQMLLDGRISIPEQLAASRTPITLQPEFTAEDRFPAAHFVEEVKQFILGDARFGATEDARRKLLFGGGLRIHTTIDLRMQSLGEQAIASVLDEPATQPDAALVAIEAATGKVRAMVGGRDYFGSSPYAKLNLAVGGGRQAGSTFKPFVLAAALDRGISMAKVYPAPSQMEFTLDGTEEKWLVRNYGGSGGGSANLVEATIRSYNTVYAQLMMDVGPERAVELAAAMGIASPLTPVPAAVLGTENVTVLEMANAYATFANRGAHVDPVLVEYITDAAGNVIYEGPLNRREVLDPEVADQVTAALQQVVRRGTGTAAALDRDAAGKTGTAEENRDAWFVGYTPQLAAAVWVGYAQEQQPMVPPRTPFTVTGGSWPAQIWQAFMAPATETAPAESFAAPRNRTPAFSSATIPGETTTTQPGTTTTLPGGSTTTQPGGPPTATTVPSPGGGTTTSTTPPPSSVPPRPSG